MAPQSIEGCGACLDISCGYDGGAIAREITRRYQAYDADAEACAFGTRGAGKSAKRASTMMCNTIGMSSEPVAT